MVHFLDALPALTGLLSSSVLVAELVVALVELFALLLEGLEVLFLKLELLSETGELTGLTGGSKLLSLLSVVLGTLVRADLVLETHHLDDHNVGTVKDERKEEGEAAKVHVALRVELAGLDFETLVTHNGSTSTMLSLFRGSGELELDTVDTVHAVNKEDQYKDEGNLHPILNLGDDGVLGNKGEDLSPDAEGHGEDQEHEHAHLEDEKHKDESVVERHGDGGS